MADTNDFFPSSPVATDSHLSKNELPFTAFGQFGADKLDLRVFEQDVYWVNTNGQPYYLDEMDLGYLTNVKRFLQCRAAMYYSQVRLKADVDLFRQLAEGAPASFEEENPLIAQQTPEEWLAATLLVQRIESLIIERSAR